MSKTICGIYKITNQINGKCYIGQSTNILKRWAEHRNRATSKGSEGYEGHFYRSIRKYGLNNFSFEILEECPKEDLNEKEIFYIMKYHSNQKDFGYNLTIGGDSQNPNIRKLTDDQVKEIFELLDSSNLSQSEIAERYGVTQQLISLINQGKSYFSDNKKYPIRSVSRGMKLSCQKRGIIKKEKEKTTENPYIVLLKCKQCGKTFYGGRNRKYCSSNCAHQASQVISRPSREILKEEIRKQSFLALGKKYKVTDNAIRKWCDAYQLPRKKSEIKTYSDEQWALI